jgi:hypothetical protein
MDRDELTANFAAAIMYWLDSHDSAVHWSGGLASVCVLAYEDVGDPPVSQYIIMPDTWLPDPIEFPEPTIADLLSYTEADVSEFYIDNYARPAYVAACNATLARLTTAQIAACYVDDSMDGSLVFDTDVKRLKYYNRGALSWDLV